LPASRSTPSRAPAQETEENAAALCLSAAFPVFVPSLSWQNDPFDVKSGQKKKMFSYLRKRFGAARLPEEVQDLVGNRAVLAYEKPPTLLF
jgi:hypothetical protein